ncbi:MAG: FtsX-like permease family protein [Phycisphaerales bacterium]|nr:FtsX-like permease family protein [Phycisphaerales bacterium]
MILAALHRKLTRDLWSMKGQALAIALVMASGIATFILAAATMASLQQTMDTYYDRHGFADVFAQLKRAPNRLGERIADLPGVAQFATRVVVNVNLDVEDLAEPALGRIISVPESHEPWINGLYLREGRYIEPNRRGEVLVSEAFAKVHDLVPGDTVRAVINGRRDVLRIVGIALSPEYIYQIRPGDILPDDKRFGVFWMSERELAPAFDMEGAFNDVSLILEPGASEAEVIRRLDALLDPYGGLGAYGRADHPSHQFVSNELHELRGMTVIAPLIFLLVAAFLLNVVFTRLISTQREQIAALKAFGYSNWQVGWHYMQMVLVIALVGAIIGTGLGTWMGRGLAVMYTRFFHFPILSFSLPPRVVVTAIGISMGAGSIGTLTAVRRAAKLPPAQAMRPEPPANFKPTILERLGLQRLVSPAARTILRELERRPLKAAISCFGIAMAAAVLVVGSFMKDSVDYVLDLQFRRAQRETMTVTLNEPINGRAVREMLHLPGVLSAEAFRTVPARLRHGHYTRRVGVTAIEPGAQLFRVMDIHGGLVEFDRSGLYLSTKLGDILGAGPGDVVTLEVLESERPVVQLPVSGLIDDFSGLSAYMRLDALHRLMGEQDRVSGAYLAADEARTNRLYTELKNMPAVAGVALKKATVESFNNVIAENLMRMRLANVIFAVIIAFGVVYNSARISLAERSRELATLRVIGFTRAEVSSILMGELALLTLVAIPLGLVLGYTLSAAVIASVDSELFRIPIVVNRSTYGFAALVVILAAVVSGLVVIRRIAHLDLIEVLKTRG